jgi:hypothetical protein
MKVGGKQCIRTNDGYVIPLDIINGLPYLKMQPPNDAEMNALPRYIHWWRRSTIADHSLTDKEDWYNVIRTSKTASYRPRSTNTAITAIVLYALPFYLSPNSDIDGLPLVEHLESPQFP